MEKIRYLPPCEAKILNEEDLNSSEKLLYITISALSYKTGFCYATNKYLAEQLNITERYIQIAIQKLKEKKYIYVQWINGNKRLIKTYLDVCIDNKQNISRQLDLFDYDWLNEEDEI